VSQKQFAISSQMANLRERQQKDLNLDNNWQLARTRTLPNGNWQLAKTLTSTWNCCCLGSSCCSSYCSLGQNVRGGGFVGGAADFDVAQSVCYSCVFV